MNNPSVVWSRPNCHCVSSTEETQSRAGSWREKGSIGEKCDHLEVPSIGPHATRIRGPNSRRPLPSSPLHSYSPIRTIASSQSGGQRKSSGRDNFASWYSYILLLRSEQEITRIPRALQIRGQRVDHTFLQDSREENGARRNSFGTGAQRMRKRIGSRSHKNLQHG